MLNQLNHDELKAVLEESGNAIPEGAINRLALLLQVSFGHIPEVALGMLRDLGRLRSGYPAHPLRSDVEEAARRIGISLEKPEPAETWTLVMQRLIEALTALSVFLETASPSKKEPTPS